MTDVTESAAGFVAETRELVEQYLKPELVVVEEPGSGIKAAAYKSANSITVLGPDKFDAYREQPLRRSGTAKMLSIDSLIAHINRFKDADSVIFASDDRKAPSITAMLDYHRAGADAAPRFGRHRSTFDFPLSDEWKAWMAKDGEAMSMVDFAAFLEERIIDVFSRIVGEDELAEDLQRLVDTLGGDSTIASPTRLMELARGLQVNENAVVQETVNLGSGEGIIRFQSEHVDASGAPLKVPQIFLIVIPVFRNGPLFRLAARLRYRKANSRLVFWYDLWRTDRTFDTAFTESIERVKTETDLPLLLGNPE